ncbi:hypothetical protein [Chitinimonas lacunae]|uniref:Cell division protein n=1 Tax=Chitinimonas lacunae TaxID=1963018 RepID=A0ABV8MKQ2_9NEIS
MSTPSPLRRYAVSCLWLAGLGHIVGGLVLTFGVDSGLFDWYHHDVLSRFWSGPPPSEALAQQRWMVALFGPTIENIGVWLLALSHWGGSQRNPAAWLWLLAGIALWAIQDIAVSLRVGYYPHLWLDLAACAALALPTLWLWRHDRRQSD